MKKIIVVLLLCFLVPRLASSGINVIQGSVEIKPLETKHICGIRVFSTIPNRTVKMHIEFSDNLKKFVSGVYPNDFSLEEIRCPQTGKERRECIVELCQNQSNSCRVVCVEFKGPIEFSFDPQPVKYSGSVRAIGKVGAAQITEVLPFEIYYTPFSTWIPIGAGLVLLASAGGVVFWKTKQAKEVTYCPSCKKIYARDMKFCPECGRELKKVLAK